MGKIQVQARAKINLTLDVLGKRADGYHEVEMVMQSIELHDTLTLEEIPEGIEVTTNHPALANGPDNIAYRAARLVKDAYNISCGIRIHIHKEIPLAAGMAGGSTDAAAVLKGLNKLWGLGLNRDELAEKGSLIGSDVPFCIRGGTALARGRGEILTPLPDAPEMWLVLAKPPLEVSTAEVYRNFDPVKVSERPQTDAMVNAVKTGDVDGIKANLANVLETVTLYRYPVVKELKRLMVESGVKALMSGSGPTVFGIADSRAQAEDIAGRLKKKHPEAFTAVSRTWPADKQELHGNR